MMVKTFLEANRFKAVPAIAAMLVISACATELTASGNKVRVLTSPQQVSNCIKVKYIAIGEQIGRGLDDVRHKALNDAAAVGADSIYVINEAADSYKGASLYAEALRCN